MLRTYYPHMHATCSVIRRHMHVLESSPFCWR